MVQFIFYLKEKIIDLINELKQISINELVKLVIKISKKKITFRNDFSKPDIATALSLNCEKAFDLIGWRNNTLLEDGITKTFSTLR